MGSELTLRNAKALESAERVNSPQRVETFQLQRGRQPRHVTSGLRSPKSEQFAQTLDPSSLESKKKKIDLWSLRGVFYFRSFKGGSRYQKHSKARMHHQWRDVAVGRAPHSKGSSLTHVRSNRSSQSARWDCCLWLLCKKIIIKAHLHREDAHLLVCLSQLKTPRPVEPSALCGHLDTRFRFVPQKINRRTWLRFSLILNNLCLLYAFFEKVFKLGGEWVIYRRQMPPSLVLQLPQTLSESLGR